MKLSNIVKSAVSYQRQQIASAKAALASRNAHMPALKAVVKALGTKAVAPHVAGDPYLCLDAGSARLYVYLHNLPGFNVGALPAFLAKVLDLDVVEMASEDYPANNQREYKLVVGDLKIYITAALASDATACQRVLVEERVITQPIYKFVCNQ